ncbi:MAG TPA: hypothetical protein VGL11_03565, partial [Candidatus Binatia bacterium]
MKLSAGLLVALAFFAMVGSAHAAAALEPFGKIELGGGAEKEQGQNAGGRGVIEALGVLPLVGNFGI